MKTDENRVLGAKPLGEGGVVKTSGLNPGGRLSPLKILFLIFAVVINCLGGIFIPQTAIPLYMDSILTIAVTACCGLWGGILCAVLSNGIMYLFDYTMLPFVICHILTAACSTLVFRKVKVPENLETEFLTIEAFLWAGLWAALANAVSGNILVDILFSSQSDRMNTATPVQGLYIATKSLFFATYLSGLLTNIVDKLISAVISFWAYKFFSCNSMHKFV